MIWGCFLGIILGCVVAFIHNRFVAIEFQGAFSIYGNSKLVLIVMIPLVGLFAIGTVYIWPIVEHGISALTGVNENLRCGGRVSVRLS
nr:PTS system protein [Raoultella sp. NCTC 9187]